MTMLESGWVIVGSTPSADGTTRTKGPGCLLVLDANGQLVTTWAGPNINDPWGNMAVIDKGASATLFVSMAGFDVLGPEVTDPRTGYPVTVNKATVLRIALSIPAGRPPVTANETVIANGFGQRADRDAFLVGPTGLALGPDDTLYVSGALGNRIVAISQATTRTSSAGTGRVVTQDGLLKRPLAMCVAPNGDLLVTNAKNGQVVEIDPKTGKQLYAQWIDADQAQSPPGNGDLFGIAVTPDGRGFYYTAQPLGDGLAPAMVHQGGGAPPKAYGYGDDDTPEPGGIAADTGEALGLPPARLTVTFGFGAGLFAKDGKDRYGLAARRPAALVDMPHFAGDEFVPDHIGGDLSVQACADDPQVAFHAVRQLARIADGVARIRWVQSGFIANFGRKETPRNLIGFRDGTINVPVNDPKAMEEFVWVGGEGPTGMHGGSYVVVRRIRIALEHWDRMKVAFQEQTIGRHKYSGAPLGAKNEFDPLDLHATDKDGNPVIPENAHVRLAAAATNGGAQILRRPYSYNNGVDFTAERWPPWRQGLEYDAGLFFVCYQRDPRTGFIKIFETVSKFDMMNQFVTHVGGGLFACPGGMTHGEFVGQKLFATT